MALARLWILSSATVFSSIDAQGRYAYGNQPAIAQWNLARLTKRYSPCCTPDQEKALELGQEALTTFPRTLPAPLDFGNAR